MPRRLHRFSPRLSAAVLALVGFTAMGCSIALDFDRSFPTQGVFPGAYIKAPNDGESALSAGALETGCGDFCEAYLGCLGQPDVCHYIWSLPAKSEVLCREPGVTGQDDLVRRCASDCVDAGTLTKSQLASINNAGECRQVALAVVAEDPAACTVLQDECRALCTPAAGQTSLAECNGLPGLNSRNCETVCESQSAVFFECVNCQPTETQGLCASAQTCAAKYARPTVVR